MSASHLGRLTIVVVCAAFIAAPVLPAKEEDKKDLEESIRSMDRASIHRGVVAHERDPLGKDSKKTIRPVLVVYFEKVPYIVCLDQIGPLMNSKQDLAEAVFWQVVFGSGDFVIQNPEQATDKFMYMLAGLESGLRAYESGLLKKPKARIELLDRLLAMRAEGRLLDYVRDHPCDEKNEP